MNGTEHLRFITVGFADMIAALPDQACDWCHQPIGNLSGTYRLDEMGLVFCDRFCYSDWAPDALEDSRVRYDDDV